MKKIKRKVSTQRRKTFPAFVIGYTNPEPPAAGFLAAWFNQAFEEQLDITFPTANSTTTFDVIIQSRKAHIDTQCSADVANSWHDRLEWIHTHAAEIYPPKTSKPHGKDQIFHLARLARGLTELTEGTAYDLGTGTYVNPSDWLTQPLDNFRLADHVGIEQVERPDEERVWFHTRGLGKFGFEEIETYTGTGLSAQPAIETLEIIAESIILRGNPLRTGDSIEIPTTGQTAEVVRHRTDPTYGIQLNLREVVWS